MFERAPQEESSEHSIDFSPAEWVPVTLGMTQKFGQAEGVHGEGIVNSLGVGHRNEYNTNYGVIECADQEGRHFSALQTDERLEALKSAGYEMNEQLVVHFGADEVKGNLEEQRIRAFGKSGAKEEEVEE